MMFALLIAAGLCGSERWEVKTLTDRGAAALQPPQKATVESPRPNTQERPRLPGMAVRRRLGRQQFLLQLLRRRLPPRQPLEEVGQRQRALLRCHARERQQMQRRFHQVSIARRRRARQPVPSTCKTRGSGTA